MTVAKIQGFFKVKLKFRDTSGLEECFDEESSCQQDWKRILNFLKFTHEKNLQLSQDGQIWSDFALLARKTFTF